MFIHLKSIFIWVALMGFLYKIKTNQNNIMFNLRVKKHLWKHIGDERGQKTTKPLCKYSGFFSTGLAKRPHLFNTFSFEIFASLIFKSFFFVSFVFISFHFVGRNFVFERITVRRDERARNIKKNRLLFSKWNSLHILWISSKKSWITEWPFR